MIGLLRVSRRGILDIVWKTAFFLSGRLLQLQRTIVCQDSELPDELLYGRAGYLYALLYLNTEIGPGTVCESAVKEVCGITDSYRHPCHCHLNLSVSTE